MMSVSLYLCAMRGKERCMFEKSKDSERKKSHHDSWSYHIDILFFCESIFVDGSKENKWNHVSYRDDPDTSLRRVRKVLKSSGYCSDTDRKECSCDDDIPRFSYSHSLFEKWTNKEKYDTEYPCEDRTTFREKSMRDRTCDETDADISDQCGKMSTWKSHT